MDGQEIEHEFGGIRVEGNAVGSALIAGDGNVVTIIYSSGTVSNIRPSIASNPYRGLDAFDESSAQFFFGREQVVRSIAERIKRLAVPQRTPETGRIFAIVGPSGCGKTSVARAGLLPALACSTAPWLRNPSVAILTPSYSPIESLADALSRLVTTTPYSQDRQREFAATIRERSSQGLHDGLTAIVNQNIGASTPVLILIDQFEETYTLCRSESQSLERDTDPAKSERDAFIATLLQAATQSSRSISVVLTLRSDFFGALSEHPILSKAVAAEHEIVPAMNREDLERAISQPAKMAGRALDSPTIDRILNEASGEVAALPLVQFALERIWDRLRDGIEPGDTLVSLGGVGGALAKRSNDVLSGISEHQQNLVRRAFLGTVQLGDVAARDTRRRAFLSELVPANSTDQDLRKAIEPFIEARLLTIGATDDGNLWIEMPHEALIRFWNELRTWIDTQREDIRFGRQLYNAAEAWNKSQRPTGSLWRSPDLNLLERYVVRNSGALTALQEDFFKASKRQTSVEKWFARGSVIGIGSLAIAAIAFALLATKQRGEAESRGKTALSNSLAANARLLFDQGGTRLQIAALLAIESLRREPNPQGAATAHLILSHMLTPERVLHFPGSVETMAVSGDGKFAAIKLYSKDPTSAMVRIYSADSSQEVASLPLPDKPDLIRGMTFSHNGLILGVSTGQSTVVWQWKIKAPPTRISSLSQSEIAFSSDDKWLASEDQSGVHVVDVGLGAEQRLLKISKDWASPHFVFSSREPNLLFVGNRDGQVSMWDVSNGERRGTVAVTDAHMEIDPNAALLTAFGPGPKKMVRTPLSIEKLWLSPDGTVLGVADEKGSVGLWSVLEDSLHHIAAIDVGDFAQLAFDGTGKILASANSSGVVTVWNAQTGGQLAREQVGGFVENLAITPDGSRIISSHRNDTAVVWDWERGEILGRVSQDSEVSALALRGEQVITASRDGSVAFWLMPKRASTGRTFSGELETVSVSPSGTLVGAATNDGFAIWKPFEGKDVLSLKGSVQQIVFDQNNQSVALVNGGRAVVLDLGSGQTVFKRDFPLAYVETQSSQEGSSSRTALNYSGANFAGLFGDMAKPELVPLIDLTNVDPQSPPTFSNVTRVISVSPSAPAGQHGGSASERSIGLALSSDGKQLAVSSFDWIWIFDVHSGVVRWHGSLGYEKVKARGPFARPGQFEVQSSDIRDMWFTEHGDELVAHTRNGALWRWNAGDTDVKLLAKLEGELRYTKSILVEDASDGARIMQIDGKVLKSLRFDGELKAVTADGKWLAVERRPKELNGPISLGGFNPGDYRLDVIEVQNGSIYRSFRNNASLDSALFSSDNRLLAAQGSDGIVRVFDVTAGVEYDRIVGHALGQAPIFVGASAALLTIAGSSTAGDEPHELAIWKLGPEKLVLDLCEHSIRNLRSEEWNEFLPGQVPRETCTLQRSFQ